MNFDPTWLFLSLIPGGIGFVLFVYGRKQGRWPQLVGGLIFMVYPYFTTSVLSLVGHRHDPRRRALVCDPGWVVS